MSKDLLAALCERLAAKQPAWDQLLSGGKGCQMITFCNPLSLKIAGDRTGFLSRLDEFDYVFADGILLAKAASWIRGESLERCSFDGNSLAEPVFELSRRHELRLALVGSTQEVVERAGEKLSSTGLSVVFSHSGYFADDSERQQCVDELKEVGTDLVVVGMGGWHQEDFSLHLKHSGWQGVVFTCGGYLDQLVNVGPKYYPDWVNRWHLRAIYRVMREPRKLLRRYTRDYLPFYLAVVATFWSRMGARVWGR